jgi:hypothetical protein
LQVISCVECEPGQYDDDQDPSTPCVYCDAGKVSWTGHSVEDELYGSTDEEGTDPSLQVRLISFWALSGLFPVSFWSLSGLFMIPF